MKPEVLPSAMLWMPHSQCRAPGAPRPQFPSHGSVCCSFRGECGHAGPSPPRRSMPTADPLPGSRLHWSPGAPAWGATGLAAEGTPLTCPSPRVPPVLPLLTGGQGQPSQNTGWGGCFCGRGEPHCADPKGVLGPEVGVGALPGLSRFCAQAIFSQETSQFSCKFSKALATHTPKGVKSPRSLRLRA